MSRTGLILLAISCALGGAVGGYLANTYLERMPDPRGYYLVSVKDRIELASANGIERPRHTVVVLVDGLRADRAATMQSVKRLAAVGQCRLTDVGSLSVSRPVYAVLSSGLEQDRSGVRNNDNTSPAKMESIWQLARRAGLRVTGVSELSWFQELYPDGFDSYLTKARREDFFTPVDLGDLTLIHPVYVDEEGHDHGARSAAYTAAVARADKEFGRLLDRLDLQRDLVIFTADHGHSDIGGHGARSPEVAQVLSCFSGHGVRHSSERGTLDARSIAPTLAALLKLPFPSQMRAGPLAGDDDLDRIWEIANPSAFPSVYVSDRRAAVQRFRQENGAIVSRWLGGAGSWNDLYARGRREQTERWLAFLAVVLIAGYGARRILLPKRPLRFAIWALGTWAAIVVGYVIVRGSFDFTSISSRRLFILSANIVCFLACPISLAAHLLIWRDRVKKTLDLDAMVLDQVRIAGLLAIMNLGHILTFGWPLGFPLPGPVLIFLPFILGVSLVWEAGFAFLGCLLLMLRKPPPLPA